MDDNKAYDEYVQSDKLRRTLNLIEAELDYAMNKYPAHPSLEHSLQVLREEFEELEDEVKEQYDARREADIRKEAIQTASMAVRLILDYDFWKSQGKTYGTVHQ